ncbi:MAG: mechanosensitive ion channel [Bacteroidetes bacterium]|nr:MAG: mechanosensitive ion channel [Bacteroidota bacterium]
MQVMIDPAVWFKELFIDFGLSYSLSSFLSTITLVLIVTFLSWLSNLFARVVIMKVVTTVVNKTTTTWDDVFLEHKVFSRLSHFAPALVIWFMSAWAFKSYPSWLIFVHKLTYIYMVTIGTVVVNSFIEAWHEIYNTLPLSKHRHIKGYVQLLKIFVVLLAVLIVISVVFRKDISTLVAGLGAMAAVIILVFKDSLLGLIASIQLSADKLLKVGDWITIPKRDVDGVVTDITLNTVKIQNFDKTIINVPTYSLVNESFQNWKGMEEAGIRQIKRSIFIDMKSIRFLDGYMKHKFNSIPLLKEYIESVEKHNIKSGDAEIETLSPFFNSSQITNLGIFRFYAETYLKQHHLIDSKQIVIVRHRAPEGNGLPLQVYAYTRNNQLSSYENIQAEIFEHLLSIMDEFGLKVFQQPTGDDILSLSKKIN